MMMNQGENTASVGGSSHEKYQSVGSHHTSNSNYSAKGAAVAWSAQEDNHNLRGNGVLSNHLDRLEPQMDPSLGAVQDGKDVASINSTPSSGAMDVSQGYGGHVAYPNTDPYGYANTGYAAYYNQYQPPNSQYQQPSNQYQQSASQYQPVSTQYQPPSNQYHPPHNQYQPPSGQYQQPPNQYQQPANQYQQPASQYQQPTNQYQQLPSESVPQQVGAYQNTGAPYQPLSSFQNSGSFAGPSSYSTTYLGPGDYQTSGSYTSGAYGTQNNAWQGGQYEGYNYQYTNYAPDSGTAYSSSTVAGTSQYEQHRKQWQDYYNQTQTEVSCAPGTENISVPGASTSVCAVTSGTSGSTLPISQIPGVYTPPISVSSSSELTPVQPVTVSGSTPEAYWKHAASLYQPQPPNTVQPHTQKLPEVVSTYASFQNHQNPTLNQGTTASYPSSYQVSQSHQSPFQPVSQLPEHLDLREANTLQIPTNPRINPNLSLGVTKTDKVSSMAKPAYVSVSMQKTPDTKVASHAEADSSVKPGIFPKSLRGYVERVLARCKDDMQKTASQDIMKQIITKATADGTLHTRDWDTEPLFPLPNADAAIKEDIDFPTLSSTFPKTRSPGRRAKSRWEPISDAKEKTNNISNGTVKYNVWNKQFVAAKSENKKLAAKISPQVQNFFNKNSGRPVKKQRLGDDGLNVADDSEASSESDKEQSLTKYYSAAVALSDSPEEKWRRENRSKRFDKGHGNGAKSSSFKTKDGPGKSNAKRASALMISRTAEESGSRAVEDIDWDALTVKGTCQEIEKRYLRLTSAPDPASVRSEEVLEKALLMVKNSPKNYLYKCDQLKSIRQDLTVQHIRNELTVKVYETHARLSIEAGDLSEYNQCQSQLTTLYAEGIGGCYMEFAAYNLLCVILHSSNNRDLVSAMSRLPADAKKDKAVMHALSVRTAVTSGNYVTFFRLYKAAPNLSTFLMDLYVEKMRYAAVKCISRSYRPTVPVSYLSQILGFASPGNESEIEGTNGCVEWLKAHGACLTSDNSGELSFDAKSSVSSLFMPEPDDAVSHGDANLAVNDFLTRSLA